MTGKTPDWFWRHRTNEPESYGDLISDQRVAELDERLAREDADAACTVRSVTRSPFAARRERYRAA